MSRKKYEAFAKIVEMGGLTRAADALGYTQSSMSHMINALEAELGFPVLMRSRSGVKLTAAGEQLLPHVLELLEKKRQIDALASFIAGDASGTVRVGAFTSVAVNWLPGIIKEFSKTHPSVEIKLLNGDYHDVEKWLENGDVDVLITSYPLIRRDAEIMNDYVFRFVILDEAQHIKNAGSVAAAAVKHLQADTRFALTGTPMENGIGELWSIFDYLMAGFLYGYITTKDYSKAFRYGIASGSASAFSENLATKDEVMNLYDSIGF